MSFYSRCCNINVTCLHILYYSSTLLIILKFYIWARVHFTSMCYIFQNKFKIYSLWACTYYLYLVSSKKYENLFTCISLKCILCVTVDMPYGICLTFVQVSWCRMLRIFAVIFKYIHKWNIFKLKYMYNEYETKTTSQQIFLLIPQGHMHFYF